MRINSKIVILVAALSMLSIPVWGQKMDAPQFSKAEIDSTSYLVGVNFGSFIKSNGFTQIDHGRMNMGMSDFLMAEGNVESKGSFTYDPAGMNDCFEAYLKKTLHTQDEIDKASYLVGVNFGAFILNYDFPGLDYSLISKGMNDFAAAKGEVSDPGFGKQFRYNPDLINDVFNRILEKQKSIKANSYKLEAQEFLQKNRYASGVMSTYSGLQYKIISKGSTKHPTEKSEVKVLYRGTKIDGSIFDEASDQSNPVQFDLAKVITGWTEGLQLVGEGGHIILYIPSELAYGDQGNGSIKPGELLIYDVELLSVVSNPKTVTSSSSSTTSSQSTTKSSTQVGSPTRSAYGKDVVIGVGETVQLLHSDGSITKTEVSGGSIVTATQTGVITGMHEGEAVVWGYVNGSPKLFRVEVRKGYRGSSSTAASTSSSYTRPSTTTQSSAVTPKLRHGCARWIHGKSFTLRVGEGITIRPEQGNVTKIEVAAFNQYIAMTGDNEVTGLKEGETTMWVHIDGSPKLFTVHVKGTPWGSASASTISTTSDNEITMRPNSMIRLSFPGGKIERLETTNEDVLAVFENNTVIAMKAGAAFVWAYVNGSPKLYMFTVSSSAPSTPSTKNTRTTSGTTSSTSSTSSSYSSSSSSLRVAYAPDVTVKVGESVQLKHREGTVTKWEVTNNGKVTVSNNGVMRALAVGDTVVWGYISGSPKIFRVKVVR